MARLGEICKLNMGQSPDSASYNETGEGIPFFQGNADFGERSPTVRVWCNAPTKIAHAGDILISVRAPIGALNIANTDCCIGRGLAALTVNESICSKQYLWYAIASKVEELNSKGTGSTFKAISKNILSETEIPLPPLDEQRRIAAILDKVTSLITLRKQQLAKLDELVKARFVEMFGDPVLNPMGWSHKRFDAICENLDTRRIPIAESERKAGIYPYYGASGIVDYVDSYIFDENILLISEDGANLVARVTPIAFSVSGKVWVNNHAHVVRFQDFCTQKYVEYHFALIDISSLITGTAQPKLNQAKLNSLLIPIPDTNLQQKFLCFYERIHKQALTTQKSLDILEVLKKTLVQNCFERGVRFE